MADMCLAVNWNGTLRCGLPRYHYTLLHEYNTYIIDTLCRSVIVSGVEGTGCGRLKRHEGPHMEDPSLVVTAGRTVRVHTENMCTGEACVIHNPSDHKMRDWPMQFRLDKGALVERACIHGVGHPDPDSVMYFLRAKGAGMAYMWMHGCDGCCA